MSRKSLGGEATIQNIQSCIDPFLFQKLLREPFALATNIDLRTCDDESFIDYLIKSRSLPATGFVDFNTIPRIELNLNIKIPNVCIGDGELKFISSKLELKTIIQIKLAKIK